MENFPINIHIKRNWSLEKRQENRNTGSTLISLFSPDTQGSSQLLVYCLLSICLITCLGLRERESKAKSIFISLFFKSKDEINP